MRHSHLLKASRGMNFFIGFLIAVAVGLTGIGGGSFTVPALILIVGLTAGEAVGTAFVFAGVLRLIAAPFYLLGRNFHARYLWLLLLGRRRRSRDRAAFELLGNDAATSHRHGPGFWPRPGRARRRISLEVWRD